MKSHSKADSKPGKDIFVVEDSKDIRDLIQLLYESEGYHVELAIHGQDALDKLKRRTTRPGVILLDLMMPGMDGFQFRREQERDPALSQIPVIIMSADANAENKALNVGAQGYLKKPVALKTLLAVAEKYCH